MALRKFAPGERSGFQGAFASAKDSSRRVLKSATKASSDVALMPAKEKWRMG